MDGHEFLFHAARLVARPSGALHWPEAGVLAVSDLHLGKSERLARRGGSLLPPYETRDTLVRLDGEIEATGARVVICLGDSFDDLAAAQEIGAEAEAWLTRMMAGRDWIWIEGNHDAGPIGLGGSHRQVWRAGGLTFRHIAEPGAAGEISGHLHPKVALAGKSHRCFLVDGARIVLPAFGLFTGGLSVRDPAIAGLMGPGALAILTGARAVPVPLRAVRG